MAGLAAINGRAARNNSTLPEFPRTLGPWALFYLCDENLESRRCEWERSMGKAQERPVVTEANKEDVRAGHTGDHVRYILIASCAPVIIAFIVIALFVRP